MGQKKNGTMEKAQAEDYLSSLLNKNLRVTTTDTRMFLGMFKCTDPDSNIILSQTFEYRLPPPPKTHPASASASTSSSPTSTNPTITMDLTSRYLGLVVIPGEYIIKIEVEEFVSQIRGKENVYGVALGTSGNNNPTPTVEGMI